MQIQQENPTFHQTTLDQQERRINQSQIVCVRRKRHNKEVSGNNIIITRRRPMTVQETILKKNLDDMNQGIQQVYGNEILHNLYQMEQTRNKRTIFKERSIVVDNMLFVQNNMKHSDESFFLAVQILNQYIDQFASNQEISRKKLDLIGITSLFLAIKLEDPGSQPKHFRNRGVFNEVISDELIFKCEQEILKSLKWKLRIPTCLEFLNQYFAQFKRITNKFRRLTTIFMTLAQLDDTFSFWRPSQLAITSMMAAFFALERQNDIPSAFRHLKLNLDDFVSGEYKYGDVLLHYIGKFPYTQLFSCQKKYNFELTGKRNLIKFLEHPQPKQEDIKNEDEQDIKTNPGTESRSQQLKFN